MKRQVLLLCIICPFLIAASTPNLQNAKEMAYKVYSKIDKTVDDRVEKLSREDYIGMYGLDRNGTPVYLSARYANDLYLLNGEKGEKTLKPEIYFGDIEEFVNDNIGVEFKFEIASVDFIRPPELKKNEDDPEFANVLVKKERMVGGKTYRINDSVCVNILYNNIASIYNEFAPLQDTPEDNLDGMLAKAAVLYNNKLYDEAAALYNRILQKYPNSDDAWYYLGVMYFKMQGVGKLSQKQRLKSAYDCWKNSNLKKARRAISYITDGRE